MIENLGQVELLVADKTGTLTMNELILKEIYADNSLIKISHGQGRNTTNSGQKVKSEIDLDSLVMVRNVIQHSSDKMAHHLFFCMTVCHSAVVSRIKSESSRGFISESEDELALLDAAKQIGFTFFKRTDTEIYVRAFKDEAVFTIKGIFPYDPVRRMMSIIVETRSGETIMYSKGADSSMFPLC